MDEHLIRWSARLAMLLYAVALALRGIGDGKRRWLDMSRRFWTLGCTIYLTHVICAFHFAHHWSNADAYAATARQTRQFVGLDWGGGLYVNYLFTLVWLADVAWWWLARDAYESRDRAVEWIIQGFMAFIAFNATVVFALGPTRWIGAAGCLVVASIWIRRGYPG